MISFVIYERNKDKKDLYIKIIKKFLFDREDHYEIYDYDKYSSEVEEEINHIEGARIYLLNLDSPKDDACVMARRIRQSGDIISPIILLTAHEKSSFIDRLANTLYLDILTTDENIIGSLMSSLKEAHRIVTKYAVYSFSVYDEIFRIPFDDIYYIRKNLNDDSVTIYTKDDTYLNYITIKRIEEILARDPRFFKIHRSCILNIYNVSSYDRKNNVVIFNNGLHINLVSKYKKAALVHRLQEFKREKIAQQ